MKLFKKQLSILEKGQPTKPGHHWVVLAWHYKWSITWSWLIWWWPPVSKHWSYSRTRWWNKIIGGFHFATQKTMQQGKGK